MARVATHIVVTKAPSAPAARAWNLDEVSAWAEGEGVPVQRVDDFALALDSARERAATVLVTGSFHTVGDAMERLQVDPLAR